MTPEDARTIIDAFAKDNPEAYRLALAASLAARVEPELVRALRLDVLPETDAGAEADLWFSPLVQSQTPLALEFEPEVLALLREDLATEQELLKSAWKVLGKFHERAPLALQLEEQLTYLGLCTESDGAESNEELIEKRLNSVLLAVREGKRPGLARWASLALPSLPDKVNETEAANRLSLVVGLQTGDGPSLTGLPSKGVTQAWLSEVTARKISHVKVGLRLLKNETPAAPPPSPVEASPLESMPLSGSVPLESIAEEVADNEGARGSVRTNALPMLVEFSYPPVPHSEVIEVPDTYRLLLEVSWQEGTERSLRQLSLLPGETRRVEVGYGEIRIRTALGDISTLRPRFDYDFMLIYDNRVERWARNLIELLKRQDWGGRHLRVISASLGTFDLLPPDLEKGLIKNFGLSRKVGFAVDDSHFLSLLEPARPEPHGKRDWLIPIKIESIAPSFENSSPVIDFNRKSGFDDSFRALWKAITGEDLPLPKVSQKARAPRAGGEPLSVFISYAQKDTALRDQLVKHLAPLESEGLITTLQDAQPEGEQVWETAIYNSLRTARIILLLVSADFLASRWVAAELQEALRLAEAGEASIVSIILRPCDWLHTPLSNFKVLPSNGTPVTEWRSRSNAFVDVVEGIRAVIELERNERAPAQTQSESATVGLPTGIPRPPVTGFVARRDEQGRDIVERLKEELSPQGNQLVTLAGPGGIGKTALAAEAVRALKGVFGSRIVWSSAEKRADFTLSTLLDQIATQLGHDDLRRLADGEKMAQVHQLVASAPTLIVLDNFETISLKAKRNIQNWFESLQCSALFTSRHTLSWTRNIPIAAMSREEAEDYLGRLIAETLDSHVFSEDVRRRIYETAEANPHVMQWVVAQIDEAQEPGAVLEELTRGEGDAAERVFGRSFNLEQVGDDGREALLVLSLFVPSATREALAAITYFGTDSQRLNEALRNLRALWLIKGLDENRRFTIEGLTRSLARARLKSDDRAYKLERRFREYFLEYARSHAQATTEDFDALEAELGNILAALDSAFENEEWKTVSAIAGVLTDPVSNMLNVRGHWDESLRISESALQAARYADNPNERPRHLLNIATLHSNRGDFHQAQRLYEESLELSKRFDDQRDVAITLRQLGVLAQERGESVEAERLYRESLAIATTLGDKHNESAAVYQLATLAQAQGKFTDAQALYQQSLQIAKMLGDQRLIAIALHGLGRHAQYQASPDVARNLYNESLHIQLNLGDQLGIAANMQWLGSVSLRTGDLMEAQRLFNESLAIYKRLGSQIGIAGVLSELGRLAEQQGDKVEARRLLNEAFDIFNKLRSPDAELVRRALGKLEGEE
jgi:tetratricopeptide (TPR) repeat protein/tRNA A37 threonylcarbamoyladenosine biosynthesis protein TsaE